jgi:rhodanese-related sulfurtransferase
MAAGKSGMPTGIKELPETARAKIDNLPVERARALFGNDDAVFVDLRDVRELNREGRIPEAFHAPRGMLEFWIDPESPYHKDIFVQNRHFVFFCASGWRSALAAKTAQDLGLDRVSHIEGGFAAWREAGAPVEKTEG